MSEGHQLLHCCPTFAVIYAALSTSPLGIAPTSTLTRSFHSTCPALPTGLATVVPAPLLNLWGFQLPPSYFCSDYFPAFPMSLQKFYMQNLYFIKLFHIISSPLCIG